MKLTKEEFKKLIFEDENSNNNAKDDSSSETKTDNKETNQENKKSEEHTAPTEKTKEVKNTKETENTKEPVKSPEKSEKETKNLNKVLESNNWKKLSNNSYQLTTDKYTYVIQTPTTNESQFINLVRKLILEETEEKIQVKIYEPGKNKEINAFNINYTTDYAKIENELKKVVNDIDSKKDNKKEEKHILDIINSAYDKLTDDEKYAFDEIYGEKLTKALKN